MGLNLTQANRVFLLEPALNPSWEAQAIGRVHRLGQTHPVEIIRLVVKDSVETRIAEWTTNKYGKPASVEGDGVATIASVNAPPTSTTRTENGDIAMDEFDFLFGMTEGLHQSASLPAYLNDNQFMMNLLFNPGSHVVKISK